MICATIYHHFINLWVADGRVMRDIINSQIIDWNFGKFSLIFLFLPPWYASKRRNESLITAHGSSFFKEIFTWCKIINFKITPMILNIKFFIWYANIKKNSDVKRPGKRELLSSWNMSQTACAHDSLFPAYVKPEMYIKKPEIKY